MPEHAGSERADQGSRNIARPREVLRVHRNAIVRVAAIARVKSDLRGNPVLELKQGKRTVAIGGSYAHRFRQM